MTTIYYIAVYIVKTTAVYMFEVCIYVYNVYSSTLYSQEKLQLCSSDCCSLFFRNLCKSGTTWFRFRFCRLSGGCSTHLRLFGAFLDHLVFALCQLWLRYIYVLINIALKTKVKFIYRYVFLFLLRSFAQFVGDS